MNRSMRFFILFACLLLPLGIVSAQDDAAEDTTDDDETTEVAAYIYTQAADSGTLQVTDVENVYALTLNGVAAELDIIETMPFGTLTFDLEALITGWTAVATTETGLTVAAELTFEQSTAVFTLQDATYNAADGSIVYTAQLVAYVDSSEDAEAESALPESFEDAELVVGLSTTLWAGIIATPEIVTTGETVPEACDTAVMIVTTPDAYSTLEYYQARAYYNTNCR